MSENLERGIREDIERFYEILKREPMFYIYGDDEGSPEYREIVVLVFDDEDIILQSKGRGQYDYVAMCRPKYTADPTAKQIEKFIQRRKREPFSVRLQITDERQKSPNHRTLEFPYGFVRRVIQEGLDAPLEETPYTIVNEEE